MRLTGIMGHVRSSVEQSMNSVAAVALDHAVPMGLYMFLDDISDFAIALSWLDNSDGLLKGLIRNFYQVLVLFRNISHEKCLIQITMKSLEVNGHIDIAKIAVLRVKRNQNLNNERLEGKHGKLPAELACLGCHGK